MLAGTEFTQPVIIIPAYQPSESLLTLILDLAIYNFPIIIINDGSDSSCTPIFLQLEKLDNVVVLHHAVNLGKGQALKTAFNYYLLHASPESQGVVTADADGQHLPTDIVTIANTLTANPAALCLGSRKLTKSVPLRSRFGNNLTRRVFQFIMGKSILDTQTGLRGIPRAVLPQFMRISSVRYEYELDMLIAAINNKMEIREIPINVIYIDGNKSSHFNPILDSIKIYFVFIRYLAGSIASACLDFFSFMLLHLLTQHIFFSLATARVFSGTFNFLISKKMIFKSGGNITIEAIKYICLALFSLLMSYILVMGLVNNYHVNIYLSKIIADVCVFFINFAIQKVLIFPVSSVKE